MLQAYALQQTTNRLNRRSKIVHYVPRCLIDYRKRQGKRAILNDIISIFRLIINRAESTFPYFFSPWLFSRFRFNSLKMTKLNHNRGNIQKIAESGPFIVGSDQVWRYTQTQYLEDLPFFFLSFATQETRKCSIAYAASFGTDEWEANAEVTQICTSLAKDFKAISVREHSGVHICKNVLGVEAVQMPDPTLLLTKEEYSDFIKSRRTKSYDTPCFAAYMLDEDKGIQQILDCISSQLSTPLQHLTSHPKAKRIRDRFPLSVQQWLRYIRDAKFLVTDSFHGCVFAIIFNVPFVCLGNQDRGSARFLSLLETFNLRNRLIENRSIEQIIRILNTPVDWDQINKIKAREAERGIHFLKSNL